MPDFEPLPRRPRAPVFEPRTGDFAVVVGKAKHRRRRHLGAAGAGVAGLAAVVALSTGGAGGTFGLDPAPPAAGVTAPPETPAPSESPEPEPTASPDPEGSAAPGGEEEPGPNGGPATEPGETPIDDGPLRPDRPLRARPVFVRDDIAKSPTMVCDTDLGVLVPAAGWCLHYDGPSTAQIGVEIPYRLLACRHIGRGGATLTFDTEQQVEFEVTGSGGRREWHWSADYPFPQRKNTVRVEDGRCARWTIEWDAIGDDGDYLRPGGYSFSPTLSPSDWGAGTGPMAVGAAYGLTLTE